MRITLLGKDMNFWAKLRSLVPSDPEPRFVRLDEEGFSLSQYGKISVRVQWSDVVEICAFKRDLFAIDEICFGFRLKDTQQLLCAGEQDVGFENLQPEMEQKFSGIRRDWFREVAGPAFAENWTLLWQIAEAPHEKEKQPNQTLDPTRFARGSS